MQEAFLRVWRFRDALPEGDGMQPWLYRVLVNTCYSQLRREVPRRAALGRRRRPRRRGHRRDRRPRRTATASSAPTS